MKLGKCLAVVGVIFVALLVFLKKEKSSQVGFREMAPVVYSEVEQHQFWDKNLDHIVRKQLLAGSFSIPEVQARYNTLFLQISGRYTKRMEISLSRSYCEASPAVSAGCFVSNDIPYVVLFIPSQMDIYHELERSGGGNWRRQFEIKVVCSVIHEMEHLVADTVSSDRVLNLDELVACEVPAWSRTCQYTLVPLIEKYRESVPYGTYAYYQAWTNCDRGSNVLKWTAFIRSVYAVTRK